MTETEFWAIAKKKLIYIKDRYYDEGILHHLAGCSYSRSMSIYKYAPCTCGFLFDLKSLGGTSLARKIYPSYQEDHAKQEAMVPGSFYWLEPEAKEKAQERMKARIAEFLAKRMLATKDWSKPPVGNAVEVHAFEWELIGDVFGQDFLKGSQDFGLQTN